MYTPRYPIRVLRICTRSAFLQCPPAAVPSLDPLWIALPSSARPLFSLSLLCPIVSRHLHVTRDVHFNRHTTVSDRERVRIETDARARAEGARAGRGRPRDRFDQRRESNMRTDLDDASTANVSNNARMHRGRRRESHSSARVGRVMIGSIMSDPAGSSATH